MDNTLDMTQTSVVVGEFVGNRRGTEFDRSITLLMRDIQLPKTVKKKVNKGGNEEKKKSFDGCVRPPMIIK